MLWSRGKRIKEGQLRAMREEIEELKKAKLAYTALATAVFAVCVYVLSSRATALAAQGDLTGGVGGNIVALFSGIAVLYFLMERRTNRR